MTRARVVVLAGASLLAAGAIVASPAEQAAVRITKDPQGYWFTDGDVKVLFYQAERNRCPTARLRGRTTSIRSTIWTATS